MKSLELDTIVQEMIASCHFSGGQTVLAQTKPSFDPLVIRRDIARMKDALDCVIHEGDVPFYGIHDISFLLDNALKGAMLSAKDLALVSKQIYGIGVLVSFFHSLEQHYEALEDLYQTLTLHKAVQEEIDRCVNEYGDVLDKASPALREIRRQLRDSEESMRRIANQFLSSNKESVVDGIVTERAGRIVVLVKASEKNRFGGLVYGDSASGQATYIEPPSFVQANNHKQELLSKEKEEMDRILMELSGQVQEIAQEELANLETLGILDAFFAKAQWGKQHDGIVATMCEERKLLIHRGRHPLIDPKVVVANDYRLEEPYRMLLITGPNTGGKTVSMKIIGLFVLMTYCGMPICAQEATIPYFDNVFVDIGDDQSVVSSLSSFSASIEKLSDVMENATSQSLALLDEIGSGTDPKEGESLAIAILNELRERKTMTVATTHYNRLKLYGKRHEDILLASVQFDEVELKPTYQFVEGLTGQSNALDVAKRYGMPNEIIKYAKFLKNQAKSQEEELVEHLDKELLKAKQQVSEYEEKIKELKLREEEIAKKEIQLVQEKKTWKENAQSEMEQMKEEALQEAEEILAQMRQMQASAKYHEVLEKKKKLEVSSGTTPIQQNDSYQFQEGETVELIANNQLARIISIRKKDIVVSMNGREVRVKQNQIRPSLKVLPKEKVEVSTRIQAVSQPESSLECNLIGYHVDEALDKLYYFLDHAKMNHLHQVRVIHGDGSGALRKAVHQCLQKDSSVKEYRLGMPQEGGTGATIVVFKD